MSSDLLLALSERLALMSVSHKDKPQYRCTAEGELLAHLYTLSSLYQPSEDKLKASVIRAQMQP